MEKNIGTLYIVATPLGNLEDITLRALRVLKDEVDYILCEDTRVSRKLLNHYGIHHPLISYNDINERKVALKALSLLKKGSSLALVSDAGTPLISDPGFHLVKIARGKNIKVVPLPGPSSPIAALSVSGFSGNKFCFLGFTPRKKQEEYWDKIKNNHSIFIFFESPKRIIKTLNNLKETLGEKNIFLARELTKMNEEFIWGSVSEVIAELEQREKIYGEITFLVDNTDSASSLEDINDLANISKAIIYLREKGFSVKDTLEFLKIIYPQKNFRKVVYKLFK